jgi:AmmeMemoRadiSam system protein B
VCTLRNLCILLVVQIAASASAVASDRQALLDAVPIPPRDGVRGLVDTVGYVTTASQMDSVRMQCLARAAPRAEERVSKQNRRSDALAAAICPHDDYYYAGRLYALLLPHIRARTVILFGAFHQARAFECRDRLVFDAFTAWRGPYGPVKISPLRAELIRRLPPADILVDDDMHEVEHSLEAIVPWLQAFDREVEIVPILVPYMEWHTMDRVAAEVSSALTSIMKEEVWDFGRDVAIVSSSDAVHYGDSGWGANVYADFGTGPDGYARAVQRDRDLIASDLVGRVRRTALRHFLYACVDSADVTRYKITWCGRFSVPLGLDVASRLSESLAGHPLTGFLVDYGTSLSEVSLDLSAIPGLGATAPNNLHHWVGYPAIGYESGR